MGELAEPSTDRVLRYEVDAEIADRLEAMALPAYDALVAWRAVESNTVRLESYHESLESAEECKTHVDALLLEHAGDGGWVGGIFPLERADWAEAWKLHFRVERVSRRIVVKPSWESFEACSDDCVIELDPGMSFGTGNHFTTRTCLVLIDAYSDAYQGREVLDVGCGSGILGIAACKLGAESVVAIDCDEEALRIARENAARNGIDPCRLTWHQLDLLTHPISGRYPFVIANIFADVLIASASKLVGALGNDVEGRLVTAGVLQDHYAGVRRTFEAQGMAVDRELCDGEWVTTAFARSG